MSETKINAFSFSEKGIIVSGTTTFEMTVSSNIGVTSNYVIPDFTQTLTGIIRLDENAPIVELKKVPIEEAKRNIYQYLKAHPGSRTSDLIIELALKPNIVVEALSQLRREGKIEGKDIGTK